MNIYDITGLGPKQKLEADEPDHMDTELDLEMPGDDHMDTELDLEADPEGVVATNLDPDVPVTVTKEIDIPLSAIEQIGNWRDITVKLGSEEAPAEEEF